MPAAFSNVEHQSKFNSRYIASGVFGTVRLACQRWLIWRRDLITLMSLEDHLLDDIGLKRSELERAVRYGRSEFER